MRFCRFVNANGYEAIGVEANGSVRALAAASGERIVDLRQLMRISTLDLERLVERTNSSQPVEQVVRFLPPIGRPEKIICVGLNYRDHALETGKQPPSEPVIFAKLPTTVIGHRDPIILPAISTRVDFEAEFVVVIGKPCCHVEQAEAMEHVFGYACGHDVSSRDWQYEHSGGQWLLGKSFDTFAPCGPYVVHKQAVPQADRLRVQMAINGEIMQDSSTSELIFPVPMLVSYLSKIFTLNPGDLIFTGTPAGVGVARKPPRFLQPGDECTVTIEGLGSLTNRCVASDSSAAQAYRQAMRLGTVPALPE